MCQNDIDDIDNLDIEPEGVSDDKSQSDRKEMVISSKNKVHTHLNTG